MNTNEYKSLMEKVPAWAKLGVTVLVVAGTSMLRREWAWGLGGIAAFWVAVALAGHVSLGGTLKRVLVLEPLVIGVALMALLRPPPEGGLGPFLFLVGRSSAAVMGLVVFGAVTPFAELLGLMRTLRVPGLLVTTLALMHRYLFVLKDESVRMRRARAARTFVPTRRVVWGTMATVVAGLFVRASLRADRIYDAMRARGWRT